MPRRRRWRHSLMIKLALSPPSRGGYCTTRTPWWRACLFSASLEVNASKSKADKQAASAVHSTCTCPTIILHHWSGHHLHLDSIHNILVDHIAKFSHCLVNWTEPLISIAQCIVVKGTSFKSWGDKFEDKRQGFTNSVFYRFVRRFTFMRIQWETCSWWFVFICRRDLCAGPVATVQLFLDTELGKLESDTGNHKSCSKSDSVVVVRRSVLIARNWFTFPLDFVVSLHSSWESDQFQSVRVCVLSVGLFSELSKLKVVASICLTVIQQELCFICFFTCLIINWIIE